MKPWTVREREPGADDDAIRDLMGRCYPTGGITWERFCHWFHGLEHSTTTIVVAEAEGRIIGMQPMQAIPHRLCGEPLLACVLNGVMVDPEWRGKGIFSDLIRACERAASRHGAALVWTMPNAKSHPGFKRLDFSFPGERRLLVWSGNVRGLAARRVGRGVVLPAAALAKLGIGRTPRVRQGTQVREVRELSERSLAIAQEYAASRNGLIQDRTPAWLRWRFAEAMGRQYRKLEVLNDGQVVGWSVVTVEEREGLSVGYLMDLAGVDLAAWLDAAGAALKALGEWGTHLVMAVVTGRGQSCSLVRQGMCPVPFALAPKRFYLTFRLVQASASALGEKLGRSRAWFTSLADWDTL